MNTLTCGCKSQYLGFPAKWGSTDSKGNPAIVYGRLCEKHYYELEASRVIIYPPPRLTKNEIFDIHEKAHKAVCDREYQYITEAFARAIETAIRKQFGVEDEK